MIKNNGTTFIKVWKIAKKFYLRPWLMLSLISVCLVIITLLSIGLPYLLKLLVDQTQLAEQNFSFKSFLKINNLYLLALAYSVAWLLNQLINQFHNFFSGLLLRYFDSALIFEGLKNFFSLKNSIQKAQDVGVYNTNLLRGAEAFGQILYTIFFIILPIVFQILGMVWVLSSNIAFSYGIYFLVFSICAVILSLLITFKTQDFFTAMYESRNQLNQFIVEKVQSSYDIKVNDASRYELIEFEKRINRYMADTRHTYFKMIIFMLYQVFLSVFSYLFLCCFRFIYLKTNSLVLEILFSSVVILSV